MSRCVRWPALFAMGAAAVLAGCSKPDAPRPAVPRAEVALSAQGQIALRATISSGKGDLRWPDFSDYRVHATKFYELNGFSLWWVKDLEPTPQARQAIALLQRAAEKGLSADDYDGSRWKDRLASLKPASASPAEADAVQFDIALTVSLMRYISDLHIGKVNPKHLAFAFDQESKKYDLPEFLKDRAVAATDVTAALSGVEPPYPGYRRTVQALHAYTEFASKDDGEQLPPVKKTLAPGGDYAGVPRLTRLLRLIGDLPPTADTPAEGSTYSPALVDAVKSFQRRHGREPDGRIGPQTLADLNVPLSVRMEQMQLALERWRWMPDAYQRSPIVVNIPEFRLRAYDKDFQVAVTMNVVVGNAFGHDTPVFADAMSYVVFRPYWAIPLSIVRADLIPHLLKDPDYMTKKGFEVVDGRQKVLHTGRVAPEVIRQLRTGKLFARQVPGPKNSLGVLLFEFPNRYDIYLHDTPAPEFFSQSRRDFSHGCIRLEKPAELAAWVLRDNPGWTPAKIREAMDGSASKQVNLTHTIPVLILYVTVVVLEDGVVRFFDDIYNHDAALKQALAKGYPYPS